MWADLDKIESEKLNIKGKWKVEVEKNGAWTKWMKPTEKIEWIENSFAFELVFMNSSAVQQIPKKTVVSNSTWKTNISNSNVAVLFRPLKSKSKNEMNKYFKIHFSFF